MPVGEGERGTTAREWRIRRIANGERVVWRRVSGVLRTPD